jgi:hypothetical protein
MCRSSGSPFVVMGSIILADLKSVGLLAMVELGRPSPSGPCQRVVPAPDMRPWNHRHRGDSNSSRHHGDSKKSSRDRCSWIAHLEDSRVFRLYRLISRSVRLGFITRNNRCLITSEDVDLATFPGDVGSRAEYSCCSSAIKLIL